MLTCFFRLVGNINPSFSLGCVKISSSREKSPLFINCLGIVCAAVSKLGLLLLLIFYYV